MTHNCAILWMFTVVMLQNACAAEVNGQRSLLFHGDEIDLHCHVCNESYYCSSGERFACPENSLAPDLNANEISDCVCVPGYNRVNDTCHVGQPPYWYKDNKAQDCASNRVTIFPGATSEQDCVCVPGYFGPAGSSLCQPCETDFYSSEHNSTVCIQCPAASSHEQTGVSDITTCKCDPGFYGPDGGPCVACAPGTFKSSSGSANCSVCVADTFSTGNATVCSDCHADSSSVAASESVDDCLCHAGFERVDGLCRQCVPGKYKADLSNDPCQNCNIGTFAAQTGATACVQCHLFSVEVPSEQGVKCECNAGYFQTNSSSIHPVCTPCPVNTYQAGQAQTACFDCDSNARSDNASVSPFNCFCNAGYYDDILNQHECRECAAGTYKIAADTIEKDQSECSLCPPNSHSLPTSASLTECICNAGYEGPDGGPCTVCVPGKFKSLNGSAACQSCDIHYFSDEPASTICTSCVTFLNSDGAITEHNGSDTSDDCKCDLSQGFLQIFDELEKRTCSGCQAGTYATSNGCQNCTGGQYADVAGLTACKDCPANSSSYDYPHVACQCHAGYYCAPDGENRSETCPSGNCIACPKDAFKDYTGGATACNVCQNNSVSDLASVSQDDCKCDLGYRQDGPDTCVACLAGRYADTLDSITCTACGDRFYTAQSDFPWTSIAECTQCEVCNTAFNPAYVNHYDAANNGAGCGLGAPSECVACPTDTFLFHPSTTDNWNAGQESCVCDDNLYGLAGGPCYACPANSIRNFSASNSSISDCVCDAGFEPDPALANTCRACPVNTYKTGPGDYNCTACPDTLVTEFEGSTDSDACVCQPGYFYANSACQICAENTWKAGYSRQAICDACRSNSLSEAGSTDLSDCLCQSGFSIEIPESFASKGCKDYTPYNAYYIKEKYIKNYPTSANDDAACESVVAFSGTKRSLGNFGNHQISTYAHYYGRLCHYIKLYYGSEQNCYSEYPGWNPCVYEDGLTNGISHSVKPINLPCMTWFNYQTGSITTEAYSYNGLIIDHPRFEGTAWFLGQYPTTQSHSFFHYYHFELPVGDSWYAATPVYMIQKIEYSADDGGLSFPLNPGIQSSGQLIWAQQWKSDPAAFCQQCTPGNFKSEIENLACNPCLVNTFSTNYEQVICTDCMAGKSTAGLLGQTYCECDAGTERESSDVLSNCQNCAEGKFKTAASYDEPNCQNCSHCGADQQVDTVCDRFQNITCKDCQANSWSYAGRTALEPCFCEAGYELVGSDCVACDIGESRSTNGNNSIACKTCADGTFADTTGSEYCELCTPYCNITISQGNATFQTYVANECDNTKDIVCVQCSACPPGQYANQSCGLNFDNDRSDTECVLCPSGFYCPGGVEGAGVDVQPEKCPDEALSAVGSDDISDCVCNPGFYRLDGVCVECPFDYYCPGTDQSIKCPSSSFTHHQKSTARVDCHCFAGFYRNPTSDLTGFNCSLCTPNDWCFNNSRYNCSDVRMLADAGSSSFDNCTCMDGFYNNGTRCEECQVNHYCVDGLQLACAESEWTNGLTRQSECVCQKGLYRDDLACVTCPANSYCTGVDDQKNACPDNSVSNAGSSSVNDCLCVAGFEISMSSNYSEPHSCQACVDEETFKSVVNNSLCQTCGFCSPTYGTYVFTPCRTQNNVRCGSCTHCFNATLGQQGLGSYAKILCQETLDTQCSDCTVCDYALQWHSVDCSETTDRVCHNITFTRDVDDTFCTPGKYVGNHSKTHDSQCLDCLYRDTPHAGQQMHEPIGLGLIYNDPYSCPIRCLPFSRLVDPTNTSLGCVTCETGNVLFKTLTQDPSSQHCQFTCRPGYVEQPATDSSERDCVMGSLLSSDENFFRHAVNVSQVTQTSVNGSSVFNFTLSHTNNGRFVILVGRTAPACSGRERRHLAQTCCYADLARISTPHQMGLVTDDDERCTTLQLDHAQIDATHLYFMLPERRVSDFADCTSTANVTADMECSVVVSILDAILFKSTSITLKLRITRGGAYASVNGAHTYVPLSAMHVEVQLLKRAVEGDILMVRSDIDGLDVAGSIETFVRATGLQVLSLTETQTVLDECQRVQLGSVVQGDSWTLFSGQRHTGVTLFRMPISGEANFVVKLYYTLRLTDRELTSAYQNLMDVAVWRNVSLLHALCQSTASTISTEEGLVLTVNGLGASAVAHATYIHTPTETVHGELGGLTSFVASATMAHVSNVRLSALYAVHTLASFDLNAYPALTQLEEGELSLNNAFAAACGDASDCKTFMMHQDASNSTLFSFTSCEAETQDLARQWISEKLGAVHDSGHVAALCAQALVHANNPFRIVLANTRAQLVAEGPRSPWNAFQNHSMHSQSRVFALFQFIE